MRQVEFIQTENTECTADIDMAITLAILSQTISESMRCGFLHDQGAC
jgi:hypothetical protein